MKNSLMRIVCISFLAGIIVVADKPASAAGPFVQVTFSGTGTGANGVNSSFSGCFQYDSSQSKKSNYTFSFTGDNHELCYEIGAAPAICYGTVNATGTKSFIINTAGELFQLQAVLPTSPETLVIITLPMDVAAGPNSLPSTCVFTDPPPQPAASFKVQNDSTGQILFSGSISDIMSCTASPTQINCPCPPPAPQRTKTVHRTIHYGVFPAQAPARPAPVCEYQPRPNCCFSRLFARGCCR